MSAHVLPYTTLTYDQVLPPTRLPRTDPPVQHDVPRYRLNLLASDGALLYHPVSRSYLAAYRINRCRGVTLVPAPPIPIRPPTTVNNVRFADFPRDKGGRMLLMTGGHEFSMQRGTLTIVRLPHPRDEHKPKRPPTIAHTRYLQLHSAWGLAVHNPSGMFALSSNSYAALVLSLDTTRQLPAPSSQNDQPPEPSDDRLVKLTAALMGTHYNNIPCIHFSPCGTLLASASIDCTFALYKITESDGRRVFQSATPVRDTHDPNRTTERCWGVHWLPPGMPIPVLDSDAVWLAWTHQRENSVWEPPFAFAHVANDRRSIFTKEEDDARPTHARLGAALYDDGYPVEVPVREVRQGSPKRCVAKKRAAGPDNVPCNEDSSDMSDDEDARVPMPRIIGGNPRCFALPSDFAPQGEIRGNRAKEKCPDQLLLVCREETISLCRVDPSVREVSNDGNVLEMKGVEVLDSVRIVLREDHRRQIMYTNIIDVPGLNLIVITAVGTGVILLRILKPVPSAVLDVSARQGFDFSTNPVLFVERVITPIVDNVIGTCIVPRPGDSLATSSVELWILTQSAEIECWDLSRGELAVDISAYF